MGDTPRQIWRSWPPVTRYFWQDHVPRHASNGGWAVIMHCRIMLAKSRLVAGLYSDEGIENVITMRDNKLAVHGEPAVDFCKAFLRDGAEMYQWLLDHENTDREIYRIEVEARRDIWRALEAPMLEDAR